MEEVESREKNLRAQPWCLFRRRFCKTPVKKLAPLGLTLLVEFAFRASSERFDAEVASWLNDSEDPRFSGVFLVFNDSFRLVELSLDEPCIWCI